MSNEEKNIVAALRHFYAASPPGKKYDSAPAPNQLYRKLTFSKQTKVNLMVEAFPPYDSV
jgi:hypothetical protein